MGIDGRSFLAALDARVADSIAACTRCGKCVEACVMAAPAELDTAHPEAVIEGLLQLLRTGGAAGSTAWADACTNSGFCIATCEQGLNPRFLLSMARVAMKRKNDAAERVRRVSVAASRARNRNLRLLSRLQLGPEELARLGQADEARHDAGAAEFVFYIGCNILRTPHIALLCLDALDALGVDYRVMGGPSHCCGAPLFRSGDVEGTGRMAFHTIDAMRACGASEMLNWCPSCYRHYSDAALPAYAGIAGGPPFDMTMFVVFLARRLEALRPLLIHRVDKRVALHEHPGIPGVSAAARALLEAIPGLEFVDIPQLQAGNSCLEMWAAPDVKQADRARFVAAAAEAGVTTLAGIYHICHRELCAHEREWPFEFVNFMELIGESMGVPRADSYKRLRLMEDVDAILADSAELIALHHLDPATLRQEIIVGMLGEKPLGA